MSVVCHFRLKKSVKKELEILKFVYLFLFVYQNIFFPQKHTPILLDIFHFRKSDELLKSGNALSSECRLLNAHTIGQ